MVIRDPVHGDIELTAEEVSVLDSRTMQRLRNIKQLGAAYLVYPGAVHTRFDHSLGTLHAASRILASLERSGFPVDGDDARLVRMAALLHDVSHIPFGHTFEDERKVFPRHDTPARLERFLLEGELGEVLRRLGLGEALFELLSEPNDWRGDIVSGTLDADLLDYLRRDSYFAGLSQKYDERIYTYFCVEEGRLAVDLTKRGLERHDAWSEIIHLLRMRYFLTERVYFHHAKVIAGAMISKGLELAVERGLREEELYPHGDETLLSYLAERGGPRAKALIDGVRSRRLYKRAYALSYDSLDAALRDRLVASYHASVKERRRFEEEIAQAAGVEAGEVIVYAPPATQLKEAALLARLPEGTRRLNEKRRLDLAALEEQHARVWRFWVFAAPGKEGKVGRAAEELLGLGNEYALP